MKILLNVTIFVLMLYFFVNCTEKKSKPVQKIDISIMADTSIYVNNELVKIDDLESRLKELYTGINTQITFTADSLTHMGALYKVQKIYKNAINKNKVISEKNKEYIINVEVNENENYHIELPRASAYSPIEYNPNNYYMDDPSRIINYWEIISSNDSYFISIIQTDSDQFFIDKNMDRRLNKNEKFEFFQTGRLPKAKVEIEYNFPVFPILELNYLSKANLIIRQLYAVYTGEIVIDEITMNILLISNPNNLSLQNIDQLLIGIDINNDKIIGRDEITEFYSPIKIGSKKLVAQDIVYSNNNIQLLLKETIQDTSLAEGFFHPNLLLTAVTDSTKKRLSDFRGKITIINWWSSSCGPCIMEIPDLNKIKEKFKHEDKLAFIAINANDSVNKIQHFIEKNSFNFVQYHISQEEAFGIGINGIPHTVILDKTGKIIYDRVGYQKNKSSKELINQIEKALNTF